MSHVLKNIEQRMKKFVNKASDTPSQSKFAKIKLNPLDITPKQPRNASTNLPSIKSIVHSSTELTKTCFSIQIGKNKSKTVFKKVQKCDIRVKSWKILEKFCKIAHRVRSEYWDKTLAVFVILWFRRLKRGVLKVKKKFLYKVQCLKSVQKNWRMWRDRRNFLRLKKNVVKIQNFIRKVNKIQKFKDFKSALKAFTCKLKIKSVKMQKSAILIQKVFRRFRMCKRYKPTILKKVQLTMHQKLIARQSALVQLRNIKKKAVQKIEKEWMKYLHRNRLRQLRKYLKSLPYECRLLYLKFKQVKKDTDLLQEDLKKVLSSINS